MKNLRFAALARLALTTSCKNNIEELLALQSISGSLTSAKVVPGVAVTSSAKADITGKYSPTSREITCLVAYGGLTGSIASGGFYYGDARHRTLVPIATFPVATTSLSTGQYTDKTTLTAQQVDSLLTGRICLSLSAAKNPNGELRAMVDVK